MRPLARAALVLPLALSVLLLSSAAEETATVVRVVDGDTLVVRLGPGTAKVRLIGVDTPESVHPRRPVEYFAKEAAAFTRRMVEGRAVRLVGEPGQPDRDRYHRMLRYVYLEDGTCLNAAILREGYGFAYVKYPFSRMEEFRGYEREARRRGAGLWGGPSPPGEDRAGAGGD